jgi:hypothetical protein
MVNKENGIKMMKMTIVWCLARKYVTFSAENVVRQRDGAWEWERIVA